MKRTIGAIGVATVLAAMAMPAAAQDGSCGYGGRRYASGFSICQAGQVQTCVGGEWQGNGTFCDGAGNGQYLRGTLGPGEVNIGVPQPRNAPIQNAPVTEDDDD